uniref:2-acylglycerol O-acyltransferase 3-like n=1 Tax=Tursiops truncatus TaxID=9739 RepID=A0A2U4BS15_TURTR|nr:2-acylglycerol O-acyltransferase 3-like [Tursiops truncatus]
MKTLQTQRLEVLSVYQYVLTFPFMGPFFSLLLLFLLFTPLWCFSVLYLVWLFLDRDAPHQGGRRSEWIWNRTVWKHLRDYYPIRLVKTVELAPDPNYGLVSHPRGIKIIGTFCNFSTESTGFLPAVPWASALDNRPLLAPSLSRLRSVSVTREWKWEKGTEGIHTLVSVELIPLLSHQLNSVT